MKLAEALAVRADIQKKIASLRTRIARCAMVQEGSDPSEDADQLLKEAFGALEELRQLLVRINFTNAKCKLPDGRKITEAVAQRDTLIARHSLLQHAIEASSKEPDRYSNAEIKWIACLPVAALHKQSDDVAKNLRELNLAIQQANWEIDLE
jgi:hypothetical protein